MTNPRNKKQLEILKKRLLCKSITIYEAIDKILKRQEDYLPIMKGDLTQHPSPYFRLLAAWCIGKSNCTNCELLLKRAYLWEPNNNVRANIVWAYFRLKYDSESMRVKFLNDSYFLVRLITLKNYMRTYEDIDTKVFRKLTRKHEHQAVRLETIRKSHLFSDPKHRIAKYISSTLYRSKDILEIDASIQTLGNMRNNATLKILTNFYTNKRNIVLKHPGLILSMSKAISANDESSAHDVLFDMYQNSRWIMIKYHIIETLSVCDGPDSLLILTKIREIERDKELKSFATKLISSMELTLA